MNESSLLIQTTGTEPTKDFVAIEEVAQVDSHVADGKVDVDVLKPHHLLALLRWEVDIAGCRASDIAWK